MRTSLLTTRFRLVIAFGLILATTAMASLATLRAVSRIGEALDAVTRAQEAEHAGFVLGVLAREEYLHQAHILLTEDDSHLDHYRETVTAFEQAQGRVAAAVLTDDERQALSEIRSTNVRIHRRLEDEIRPAMAHKDRAAVRRLHDLTETEVDRIVHLSGDLSAAFKGRIDASTRRAHAVGAEAYRRALLAAAVLLLLSLGAGAWILRSVNTPLLALQRGVGAISRGDLSTRITLRRADEFGALAEGISHMAAELKEQQDRLVQSEKLAGLGRVAAGVAHELNNPLGVILGYVRLLLRRETEPKLAESLQIIEDEARQCLRIVEGLRDHVRPLLLDRQLVDLVPLIRETAERLSSASPPSQIQLELSPSPLWVHGDGARLRQVVANLLRNALEASPPGAPVTLQAMRTDEGVRFSVRDRGSGLPEEHRGHLFEPFFTTKDHGSGLGLSICDAIVRAHDGEILVESTAGEGAVFTVRLPADPLEAEQTGERPGQAEAV